MRDLKRDLEICDAATPGPWHLAPPKCGPDGQGVYANDLGCVCEVGDPYPRGNNHPQENMEFIAEARTGWPEAIQRALDAEAELQQAADACLDWNAKVEKLEAELVAVNATLNKLKAENEQLRNALLNIKWGFVVDDRIDQIIDNALGGGTDGPANS